MAHWNWSTKETITYQLKFNADELMYKWQIVRITRLDFWYILSQTFTESLGCFRTQEDAEERFNYHLANPSGIVKEVKITE